MILDSLKNAQRYPGDRLQKALTFVAGLGQDAAEGRHELDGDEMFAFVATYLTKPVEEAYPEAHNRYLDVQALLEGEELVGWDDRDRCETVRDAYREDRDILFYEKQSGTSWFHLRPGQFAVFWPGDAHSPCVHPAGAPVHVRKVVVKIRVP